MVKRGIVTHILFIFSTVFCFAQTDIPSDYFINPLDIPLVMAGTFGELRSNHFHSGLDIKTQRKEGLKVYASADGFISRIKISHYGYGKAIYIQHPNGYTTVYAHLKKFSPEIEAYVKDKQYKKENYEIEVYPTSGTIPVTQGELIAYSGNTGGSGGPHLHYEIRDVNARPMNPFLFGIDVTDTKPPKITKAFVYPLDENSYINRSQEPVELRISMQKDSSFIAEKIKAQGNIGFGISTIDQQNGANNKNGIYQIQTTVNGEENFLLTMDKFSFAETRYLNRMIDYGYFIKKRERVQKLFIEKNNPLSIYKNEVDNGILSITDSLSYQYTIKVKDYAGNVTRVNIPIIGAIDTLVQPKTKMVTDHYAYANQPFTFSDGKFTVYIPKGALYDDTFLHLRASSDSLDFHQEETPLHKNAIISYDLSAYNEADREKLYIGRLNYKGDDIYYSGTQIKDNLLTTATRTFGTYTIGMDKTPPVITPKNVAEGRWMSKYRYLKFKIEDEDSGIKSYRATINGKYILMEYDYKTNTLIHDFNDNVVTDTENNLKLIVTDNVGNSATFETTFFRKK
ncbi:M23 family metallopeptidase [uncultured Dokdonia sp.]|uniref:M23 family metallopeptidase n=1 Tax=uncultured Dokdonia sp. TaxID=575653 RepID=UPI0026325995|nr:M23 family metallopeptidase [uncultured Dokdonia sp.]